MITITPLDQVGEDERGGTFVYNMDRSGQFIVAHRKAGSASGRHYHKGVSPNKNPEKLILMKGTIQVNWRNMGGALTEGAVKDGALTEDAVKDGAHETGSITGTGPALVVIPAGVWHEVLAVTDFVMLELNALADGNGDTYRL